MRKLCLILVFLLTLTACAAAETPNGLTVTFLSVGKADAILLQTENSAVLIDAATNKLGEDVVNALRARGVESLDLFIVTHFDKDHVGGADKVLESFPIGAVLEPDYPADSKQFTQYREALQDRGLSPIVLSSDQTFELDGVSYFIDTFDRKYEQENDFSLVVRAEFGEVSFFFAGDAERPRLEELIFEGGLEADVLKVPHHGAAEKNSALFFDLVGADWAVITSSEKDPEDSETVLALEQTGANVLLTREGEVTIQTDGQTLSVVQAAQRP